MFTSQTEDTRLSIIKRTKNKAKYDNFLAKLCTLNLVHSFILPLFIHAFKKATIVVYKKIYFFIADMIL